MAAMILESKKNLTAVMKQYMKDWDKAVTSSKNADELRAQVKKRYANLGMYQ